LKKKIRAGKKFEFFFIKKYNLLSPRPPYRTSKPSTLKRGHPTLQNIKLLNFFYFCGSFLPSWIRIPDPDPLTRLNPDPLRIQIRNPAQWNPKPKHCRLTLETVPTTGTARVTVLIRTGSENLHKCI
jgi:hypothetical protein